MVKISVILPIYNAEDYLEKTLDSIINQSLNDIEIICVDDGSKDDTFKILKEYEKKDTRIKLIKQDNFGAANARNKGIELANGKYLAILDADDIYETNMFEKMYNKAIEQDCDIVISNSQNYDNKTFKVKSISQSFNKGYLPEKKCFSYLDIEKYIFNFSKGWAWDKLFKTSFIKNNAIKFQEIRTSNDVFFVFVSLVLANKIACIDDVLITHRINSKNQLSNTRELDLTCFIKAIKEIENFLVLNGLYEKIQQSFINWVVSFSLWHYFSIKGFKNRLKIKDIIKNEVIEKMNIKSKKKEYFYNYSDYFFINNLNFAFYILYKFMQKFKFLK